jgi:hypothetical protein
MASAFDPGALLSHVYQLPRGPRVRLRLVQRRDEAGIRALLAQHGDELEDLEVRRLVHFDPRRRVVICATALVGASETLVGLGAIELPDESSADAKPEPEVLVVDEHLTDGLDELLTAALTGRAMALARARAA